MTARRHLLLEFSSARAMTRAESNVRDDGWTVREWFGPTPRDGDDDIATALYPRSIPIAALFGGLLGGLGCFGLEYYAAVFDYAVDVGGRPMDSAIAFVPAALETTLLGAALGAVVAFLFAARLPRFHHPLFDVAAFNRVSDNRYFLSIDAGQGDRAKRARELVALTAAIAVYEVHDDA
ncbi:MAG TPA: quinol:electron acceptor oxidoreductase subunit ActD [Rudaea sp.]|jgi:hypothetical protein|nr:quinol:electron acceptor oxidoreductase subunit ActD [Rudaea sp.]